MPTRVRSTHSSASEYRTKVPERFFSRPIGLPSIQMRPAVGISMKLMQRKSVLFPDPLEPRIAIRSPDSIERSIPRSTSVAPKLLRKPSIRRSPSPVLESCSFRIELALQAVGGERSGIDQTKINQRHDGEGLEREKGLRAQCSGLVHQLVNRNDGRDRRHLR